MFFRRSVGGTTRAPVPGTTLHFISFNLPKGFRLVDTPGIPSRGQVSNLLTEGIDLYGCLPRKKIAPITYVLQSNRTLLVGSLVRIDQVKGAFSFVTCFFSRDVTLHVCQTHKAQDLLDRKATTFFYPPHNREDWERMAPLVRHRIEVFGSSDRAWDDIVIAGFGWVSISSYGTKDLDVWVPKGVKVFRRPALMPQEVRKRGISQFREKLRARGSKIQRKKRTMVQMKRDKEIRDRLRAEQAELEEDRAADIEIPEGTPFVEEGLELPPEFEVVTEFEEVVP